MKSWQIFGLAGLMVTGLSVWSGPAQAQYYGGNIDQREAAQEQRIQNGIRSGAITPREAGRLEAEQQRIRDAEARMRADGRLDPREKARLDRMQNKADRDISRENHDRQVAYPNYGNHYEPRYRHWQDNQRRDYRQENHYYRRGKGSDRDAFPAEPCRSRQILPDASPGPPLRLE